MDTEAVALANQVDCPLHTAAEAEAVCVRNRHARAGHKPGVASARNPATKEPRWD